MTSPLTMAAGGAVLQADRLLPRTPATSHHGQGRSPGAPRGPAPGCRRGGGEDGEKGTGGFTAGPMLVPGRTGLGNGQRSSAGGTSAAEDSTRAEAGSAPFRTGPTSWPWSSL